MKLNCAPRVQAFSEIGLQCRSLQLYYLGQIVQEHQVLVEYLHHLGVSIKLNNLGKKPLLLPFFFISFLSILFDVLCLKILQQPENLSKTKALKYRHTLTRFFRYLRLMICLLGRHPSVPPCTASHPSLSTSCSPHLLCTYVHSL